MRAFFQPTSHKQPMTCVINQHSYLHLSDFFFRTISSFQSFQLTLSTSLQHVTFYFPSVHRVPYPAILFCPSSSASRSELLNQSEPDEQQQCTRTPLLPVRRMTRQEEQNFLGLFIKNHEQTMVKEERAEIAGTISEEFVGKDFMRPQAKPRFEPRRALYYYRGYNRPTFDRKSATMPYEQEDGMVVMRNDNKPKLDKELMECEENTTSVSPEY